MINSIISKPFLKWAGGKTQLLPAIERILPKDLYREDYVYVEPFVGSGAVLFWILGKFPNIKKAVINDINTDLINTYKTISKEPNLLISFLEEIQQQYYELEKDEYKKKEYYYKIRESFNLRISSNIEQSAYFIFLNRTCFNGLFRVNKNNQFNVPIGSYKKPRICDSENILSVHESLKKVEILNGDFEETLHFAQNNTLFYFDPPYKPLSETSSFNSYAKDEFNDKEQIRLRDFCKKVDSLNYYWILSNSDVKGKNNNDNFFDELYSDFEIQRVYAKRSINANPQKRGELTELLITNIENTIPYERAI